MRRLFRGRGAATPNGVRVACGGVLYTLLTVLLKQFDVPALGDRPGLQFAFNLTTGVAGIAVGLIMIGAGVRTGGLRGLLKSLRG